MKTPLYLIVLSLVTFLSCSKDKDEPISGGFPLFYNLYLNLDRADGIPFQEGEIEAKGGYITAEGETIYTGDWYSMTIEQDNLNTDLNGAFGPLFLSIGWEDGMEPEIGKTWSLDYITQLRYAGVEEVDVIRVNDTMAYPDFRYFDIYKNDVLMQRFDALEYESFPWSIAITK